MRPLIAVVPIVLVSSLLASGVPGAGAAPPTESFCQLAPGANNVWTGNVNDDWEEDGNWSDPAGYPGPGGGDPDACIPTGGEPRIASGQEQHLRTLDVANGAVLHVDEGGKLFLYGDPADGHESLIRSGGRVNVVGATLGGISRLHVRGRLVVENNGPGAASTLLTRECAYFPGAGNPYPGEDDCSTAVSSPKFAVEVDDPGVVDVRGGGVNLGDQTRLLVRGTVLVRVGAYLAADHGTRLDLRPHRTSAAGTGTLQFNGDGGYLEGKTEADTGIAALSVLSNEGLVRKYAGDGQTLVTAAYSQPSPGAVAVRTGTLLLPTGPVTPAFVAGGATYGTGACTEPDDPTCVPQTTTSFRQTADLRVPAVDSNGARVKVRKLGTKSTSADLGLPFEVHATGLAAGPSRPAVIRLRYDASVLGGKGWRKVAVYRKAGTNPYRFVRACTSTGKPPTGEVACVDRRGLAGSSRNIANTSGNPDVLMVIRTTATSRWVGR
jgi:hypothetical protein